MNLCPNCGAKLDDLENFCPFCGMKFSEHIKSDDKDKIIDDLNRKIILLEQQIKYSKDPQIEELKRELYDLRQQLNDVFIEPKPQKQSNEGWVACCCFIVIILFLFIMFGGGTYLLLGSF
jgi:predicted amidophosphoribosyltransferase